MFNKKISTATAVNKLSLVAIQFMYKNNINIYWFLNCCSMAILMHNFLII
jgi:hypothetical protein